MNGLVNVIAPRSWRGAFLHGAIFMLLIHAVNYVFTVGIRQVPYSFEADLVSTSVIALPFIALVMATLHHQFLLQVQLGLLASTDMLTGLPNRRTFLAQTAAVTRDGQPGALLLLDADHFKKINDTFGHAIGDQCLIAIAARLRENLRRGDVVGRLGGEEFSIFLPKVDLSQAMSIGDRLCRQIAIEAEGQPAAICVTLSIGAAFSDRATTLDTLMAKADSALYRAKAEGRARMVLAT